MGDLGGYQTTSRCCACGEEAVFQTWRGDKPDWAKQICGSCNDKGFYISGFGDLCQRGGRAFTTGHDLYQAYTDYKERRKERSKS